MCGIAGWADTDPGTGRTEKDPACLKAMCDCIRHRGPDDEGFLIENGVALGMRRLSVIDLETGSQPVWNRKGDVGVVMNGEIYNFLELRKELEADGAVFVTNSDTEVIPHLYERYGPDLVERLDGMFALALWDRAKQRLLIARDRFGEKPLYYGEFGRKLIFGSELKALIEHPEVETELEPDALFRFLSFDYVPAPLSIFRGIRKLPAAHFLIWERGDLRIRKYWDVSFEKGEGRPEIEDASLRLRELLSESVRRRLLSDVPLGILLSGGIDSSTVAALAVRHSKGKIKTFSIGFEEASFDESSHARLVADHLGTDHHEQVLSVDSAADLITEIAEWLDEPMSDPSLLPTYLLSRFVRGEVTVALGGDGGDEIFAGYPMYLAHKMNRFYKAVPRVLRSRLVEPVVGGLSTGTGNLTFDYKAKRFISAADYDDVARHHIWFGSFAPDEKDRLLTKEFAGSVRNRDTYSFAAELLEDCDSDDLIEKMQYLDMKLYLAEDILTKVDRASMAVSLEVRAPFLDHRVAEFAAALPSSFKHRGRTSKFILKKAVRELIPAEIIARPKKGFGMPVAEWLKGRLNPLMKDLLDEKRLRSQGIFEPAFVNGLIVEHESGKANHYKQLWTLMIFQLWSERFLNRPTPSHV